MIEVLFGESEAASMKAAKVRSLRGMIPGSPSEVVCLGFLLDIGSIREAADSEFRSNLIYGLFAQNETEDTGGISGEVRRELRDGSRLYAKELERLRKFAENGEPIRIWYSDAPYSLCGFCHTCAVLRSYDCEISVVKLPEYVEESRCITRYTGWGEVDPGNFKDFLKYEKRLSKNEIRMMSHRWSDLTEDNSPLRAVINGQLVGVSEDFYDCWIRKHLTAKPVKEARLIGDLLGMYRFGIGDGWYASRIEQMIQNKEIEVIEDSPKRYGRMIRSASTMKNQM
ncbi:DUF3658 domain-containing protein [Clostridium sp. AM58-1XD]|uniref:DUF3658 domain-containing protein n=1 Tax=Clostridium sp. AM58-1XD TaxID=2292307 RepID=UPI000E494AE3|nr:DUF3658 domain-containing protein [Clostridium sp. AM58-1XD]RGY96006.1 DUF1835 domain-containing protein [Clostridium sp. AM58-1XD]